MQDLEKFRQLGDEAYGVLLGSGDRYFQGVEDAMRYVVAGHVGSRKFAHLLGAVEAKVRQLPEPTGEEKTTEHYRSV